MSRIILKLPYCTECVCLLKTSPIILFLECFEVKCPVTHIILYVVLAILADKVTALLEQSQQMATKMNKELDFIMYTEKPRDVY